MIVFPNAKINFGLRIVAKRPDGYHDIETIFYPVMVQDALEFIVAETTTGKDELTVTGIDLGTGTGDNLVLKALSKLRLRKNFPFIRLHLHKAIPAGAGLGGGSSDAACLLKSVNRFFSLGITDEELKAISLETGSDCPFFIDCLPSFATGRGEILTHLPEFLKGFWLALLNPGVHVSTKEAYQNCRPSVPEKSLADLVALAPGQWKNYIVNDFEDYAINRHPVIGTIKKGLYDEGAILSLMSGSGSSVFGIFSSKTVLPAGLNKYILWQGQM